MLTRAQRYAAGAAAVVVLAVLAWVGTPRDAGVAAQWETRPLTADVLGGHVLGGRALVARSENVAVDLVTGKQITLGSVSGGIKAVAGQRFLILSPTRLEAATLDATQRWSYPAPGDTTLSYVAGNERVTLLRQCPKNPGAACDLVGVGTAGRPAWTTPEPSDAAGRKAVLGPQGALPAFGLLPGSNGSLWLIDPDSGRFVLRPHAEVTVATDGTVRLAPAGSPCTVSEGRSIDTLRPLGTTPPCPGATEPAPATAIVEGSARAWWWPLSQRGVLTVSGRHTAHVVGDQPTRLLRSDETGLTVRVGDVVRRYAYAP